MTPVAQEAAQVRELAATAGSLSEITARESVCRACPRLVAWREQVAVARRRSFSTQRYWGRPVPGWGDERAAILILGLAPAAHGGNRTGRVFTGDRSGDWLFASLWRCGLASQPHSVSADDGQALIGTWVAAAVRCAPPANKPTPAERDTCAPWLAAELGELRPTLRVVVCLGHYAWQALWPQVAMAGYARPPRRPTFGHGVEIGLAPLPGPAAHGRGPAGAGLGPTATGPLSRPLVVMGCYHPSQQNTFTGRVTEAMLDAVFGRASELAR